MFEDVRKMLQYILSFGLSVESSWGRMLDQKAQACVCSLFGGATTSEIYVEEFQIYRSKSI
jgi:hypothetical protein